jgi:CHASE2 domain-containing sensor protein/class 3 adenylate cyclase
MGSEAQVSRIAVLLFTDMADSVALERRIGTDGYSKLLVLHHKLFRRAVESVGKGKIHFDTGDGFLAEFTTATEAVNAALLFQMLIRTAEWPTESPRVRIGLHQGQLAEIRVDPSAAGRIVGIPVSIASRVMNLAQPGQILMTRPVYDDARQFVRQHPTPTVTSLEPEAESAGSTIGLHLSRGMVQRRVENRPSLKWKSHGPYLFKGTEELIEIFEVGADGLAPLKAPPDAEKAHRAPTQESDIYRSRRLLISVTLTAVCGLVLWAFPVGDLWVNSSYDYLFRFNQPAPTNQVVIVFLDNDAYQHFNQVRGQPVDRSLHTRLLNKLADDQSALVVFDIFFATLGDSAKDDALANAIRRQKKITLMASQVSTSISGIDSVRPLLPADLFLNAAGTNWGVAWFDSDIDLIVRRLWPALPVPYESLSEAAARVAGAKTGETSKVRWLHYYNPDTSWTTLGYQQALAAPPFYFRDKTVFVGNKPRTSIPDGETDEFRTPFTRWTGETVGGVELHATSFLNLLNNDWLSRPAWLLEILILTVTGVFLGGVVRMRPLFAVGATLAAVLVVVIVAVLFEHRYHLWFPWLVIVGGQVPCAVICGLFLRGTRLMSTSSQSVNSSNLSEDLAQPVSQNGLPSIPEYDVFHSPIGEGGFGKVWLARNAIGQWQAIKIVRRSSFESDVAYGTEFEGIAKYKPVSEKHPGLLRIELISERKSEGYFYYVMELGDACQPEWQKNPALYRPKTLATVRSAGQGDGDRLPVRQCISIGLVLAEALDFLHSHNLTHRDIKPSNVIFVNNFPKLADVGLVTNIRSLDSDATRIGTPGYMPPAPEPLGTRQADIYALGMLLYVISTGKSPDHFPILSTALLERSGHEDFMRLDSIILKACQIKPDQRYASVSEMRYALQAIQ